MKRRIDLLLIDRGLAPTRQKAQAMILAGQVLVNQQRADKPGQPVPEDAAVRVLRGPRFASRGGAKLESALDFFGIPVEGRICADLGASTGGFTDCLLQRGAAEVHAYDVGRGQLDWRLRSDSRVVVHDEFNVRFITTADLPAGISLITADLSFISLTKVLAPLRDALLHVPPVSTGSEARATDLVLLVKPQFEVGKGEVGKGGIVRDPHKRLTAVLSVDTCARECGFRVIGCMPSPMAGARMNQEFLMYLRFAPGLSSAP